MARPTDPRVSPRSPAPPTGELVACGWCLGVGSYLEAMDCDVEHVYLPVVCAGCEGTGRRSA